MTSSPATTGYQIKDVAAHSGFSAATLRYYEQIGLLPPAVRNGSGYRRYDDRTLERLGFIAHAKQLGCTLDEIAALTSAWEGGTCGPLQVQLQALVVSKLADAKQRIAELQMLTADLERAERGLSSHRPEGACDDRCGCTTDPIAERQPSRPVIACTLPGGALQPRLDAWTDVLEHCRARSDIDGGLRLLFETIVPVDELVHLTTAERDCCGFFEFAITVDERGVGLEVRAPAEALAIVHELFGPPS